MPDDVRAALENSGMRKAYDARPPYQRNDYIGWITKVKAPETRAAHIQQMLDELKHGDVYMKMDWNGKQEE
ncbi:hypothetical protein FGD77_13510 [Roseovarius sp. M141]|nr:hypothetical protein [Roseovarius sp. M141]